MSNRKAITIRLEEEIYNIISDDAKVHGVSISSYVSWLISQSIQLNLTANMKKQNAWKREEY